MNLGLPALDGEKVLMIGELMKVVKQLLKPLLQLSLPLWIDQERDEFRQLGTPKK